VGAPKISIDFWNQFNKLNSDLIAEVSDTTGDAQGFGAGNIR